MSNVNSICLKSLIIGNSCDAKQRMLRFPGNSMNLLKFGLDFKFVTVIIDRVFIKMQVWDIAGQERLRTNIEAFLPHTDIIYFVYDMTDASSFRFIQTTLNQINQRTPCNSMKILVGLGREFESQQEVIQEEIMELSLRYKIKHYEFDLNDDSQVSDLYFKSIYQFISENQYQIENQHSTNKCVIV
ncbi:Ras family protein [Entamoeba histolytica HM-1:IMSS]|uniref:Ras family protein n=2 Tax=Entamoeba histolytica TaxID=5759 RepID=A0A8U0WQ55_ENTH1|eukprot:XP_647919.1 Ras family protein [Entamoeba histolytica HM-1:IMSS]